MRRFGWVAFALFYFMLVGAKSAQAEKRIALLIANQGYSTSVGTLKNPFNDIAVVGDALSEQGFEILPPIKDGKRSVMLGGVRELVRRLNSAGAGAIGFIYYSGHGAAEKDTNINYLIPVDASAPGTSAFWDDSVKLDDVLRLLDGARSAAKFVVFDACRNELQLPTKDTSKGLVPVAEQQGIFIAYASAPGRTASDMGDKSGPYAAALAVELAHPGLDHLNLFQNVKEAVLTATGGAQQPWESNGLGRRVYLTGDPKIVRPAGPTIAIPPAAEAAAQPEQGNPQPGGGIVRREPSKIKVPQGVFFLGVARGWSLTSSDALVGRNIDLLGGAKLGRIQAIILNGTRERVGVVVAAEEKEIGIRLPALKITLDRISLNVERTVLAAIPPFDRCERDAAGCATYGQ
jgi:Caspase domain